MPYQLRPCFDALLAADERIKSVIREIADQIVVENKEKQQVLALQKATIEERMSEYLNQFKSEEKKQVLALQKAMIEGGIKEIPLTKGKIALVDNRYFEYLNQFKWRISYDGYVFRELHLERRKYKRIYMHRTIMQTPEGMQTDHVNGNKLDNRLENLRICTRTQNLQNQKIRSTNTSGYKGVYWWKSRGKWRARIYVKGHEVFLGDFKDIMDAVRAYDNAAHIYFGEFAKKNLIGDAK